jgi:hypothetical protein
VLAAQAFVDEAGQRARTTSSSDHFVLSAVLIKDADLAVVARQQAALRVSLNRRPGDPIHWRNVKSHSQRLHAARSLAAMPVTISSVVVCKRHLAGALPDEDHAYLYTLRFLLERLSWWGRDRGTMVSYTIAHVVRFKLSKLRQYENRLRGLPGCEIRWQWLDPHGGRLDQPSRVEQLQLADIAASATFRAFESHQYGNTEPRYLQDMAGALYRRRPGPLTSYGLKMHPWNDATRAAYPWVAAL